ncbi:aminotransferase class III-fold pyridoxal phosphate-dependent enzyme [Eoetvoesiella caeni]|uniref:Glutamate-1-semialdehyde 2,1-aminomutase n=1 Tax=Eoetvoesiella caeni TaxID=645616 RepID=A0A366HJ45_9BURK|nr:aminotransferase class III-fold pyridoxal phosphate-dependent enzyme [Eoetvoesiella caeni]MCI2807804.1 aminotransferase class III-fold pyridoxal phosphate-dependent enzyme [Eoetvoesiella caeni]NYT54193.1 aminotransferase class III-fold pyridoxal phosphate-dependent enzyme [Eoetvoesiella caeni]RBP41720.1 glutamate-1-semialdehyde 2,1-aminomutase [Eoetvoesiella caeni]
MRVVAIIQARMGSTRLPNKVMKPIDGVPMIELLLARLAKSVELDQIIVATAEGKKNQYLSDFVSGLGYFCFAGSENDVLDRFYAAANAAKADAIVRITGDCPLVDSTLVDEAVREFKVLNVDYFSNVAPPTFPDGLDIEVMRFDALEKAWRDASDAFDREHVTPYLRRPALFRQGSMVNTEDFSNLRWTVDEAADFEVIKQVFEHFSPSKYFTWRQVLELQLGKPDMFAANQHLIRNEGATMATGQKLWKRAKQIIPGGNMLLSKRAEMFLPERWPAYFSKAKGCKVWDMDGNAYIDMSIMGVGTNLLGYGNAEVDEAVRATVTAGNMSTFNCPEEVWLAEKLIELHPWADMVRFARAGGEANAVGIRIARAAVGRDNVAVCGYHGWHDWYLSANLGNDETLAGHLLPGLEPKGVPQHLRGTVFPFNYNNYAELENLVDTHDIGIIKMEVSRNHGPEDNFLHRVRELATKRGIVLIFDECTSGFRQTFGGLHKMYGVEPDMAMFGKALGNGYAITAIIGRREIMEAAQTTFISSTFWTERIGPSAALKTLEVMERTRSWEKVTRTGLDIRQRWQDLADKHDLKIEHWGLPALTGYTFASANSLAYKTLITQEMLSKGYLAGNSVYVCTEHTPEIISGYFEALGSVFGLIKECEDGRDVMGLLKGPVCHGGFKRLN